MAIFADRHPARGTGHHLRRRRADPGLHLRRRRRRRLRPGRHPGRRAPAQCGHGQRALGQPTSATMAAVAGIDAAPRLRAGPDRESSNAVPSTPSGPASTWAGARGPISPSAGGDSVLDHDRRRSSVARRSAKEVLGRGAHDLGGHRAPRSHRGSPRGRRPRGPRGLAHHQLGGRGHLVGHADLGDRQLPAEGVGVPRRSTTAATPAQPMATSVTPWRQGRPKVSDTITPPRPRCARRPSRIRRAERSASSGSRAAQPSATLEKSTPALAQTKP